MILTYNFINEFVFEYLKEIDHFFAAITVSLEDVWLDYFCSGNFKA